MQFLVNKTDLRPALTMTEKATAAGRIIPTLSNVRIVAEDDELTLTGTDTETTITMRIPAQVDDPGAMAIDPGVLGEWVASIGASAISVRVDPKGQRAKLTAGSAKATLPILDADDFPRIPDFDDATPLATAIAPSVRRGLELTQFIPNPKDNRAHAQGVGMSFTGSTIVFLANDSFRIADYTVDKVTTDAPHFFIIPQRSAKTLISLIPDDARTVDFAMTDNQLLARIGDTEWATGLISGNAYDLSPLMAIAPAVTATCNRSSIVSALRGSRSLQRTNNGIVSLAIANGQLAIRAVGQDGAADVESLIDAAVDGDGGWSISVDGTKLADVLGTLVLDDVMIGLPLPDSRNAIHVADPRAPQYRHRIAPMQTGGAS